jgi:predicted amidophosphoribosyltransferase
MDLVMDYPLSVLFVTALAVCAVVMFVKKSGGRISLGGRVCSNCGMKLPAKATYCSRCGEKLGGKAGGESAA